MNREILFRGKRVDGKGWVYGGFTLDAIGQPKITVKDSSGKGLEFIKVIPSTVGQFTGLTDKNGTKIFEGDVMKWECGSDSVNVIVVFQDGKFGGRIESYNHISHHIDLSYLEITGTIHDNPTP